MKLKIKEIRKLIWNKRLTKIQVKLFGSDYACAYTDALNDILTELHRINH